MADIAFGGVEKVIRLALKIQMQVKTVRQNEHECQAIEEYVSTVIEILTPMKHNAEAMIQQGVSRALLGLERCLNQALDLVKDCQESSSIRRFFKAGDMSRQLRQVQDDLVRKMMMVILVTQVLQVTAITWTRIMPYRGGVLTQPQDAGGADISYSQHLTAGDARSGVNNEIAMSVTGSEVPCAPSSRLTTFSLSETEATIHHFSEENIGGAGGTSFMTMQKIVFKISMPSERSQAKALSLVAKALGVSSMGITGDGKDQLEVVGADVDVLSLLMCLRKKVGHADVLIVEEVKDKKKPVEPSEEGQERMGVGDGPLGGVASAAARQSGRSYSSSEGTGQPDEPKIGARKSKKGLAMACRAVWRQLRRRANGQGSGRRTSRLHHQDSEDEE